MKLSQEEMRKFTLAGKTMIWQYRTLWQIMYSPNVGKGEHYLLKILYRSERESPLPITKRGRFFAMTPEDAMRY